MPVQKLLKEDGDKLLQEIGDFILLEQDAPWALLHMPMSNIQGILGLDNCVIQQQSNGDWEVIHEGNWCDRREIVDV